VTERAREQGQEVGAMSARGATWIAWSMWALCVVLIALALVLDLITDDVPALPGAVDRPGLGLAVLTGVLSLAYPTVGALIASRLPTHPVGWIFCGAGLLYAAQRFSITYADYALLERLALPGGEYVAWLSGLIGFSGLVLAGVFLMLLFPDGRLLSRRWQVLAWTAVSGAVLTALYNAFYPDYLSTHSYVDNPFGVVGVIGGGVTTYEFFIASALVGEALLLASFLAALFSLFVRLHRARGDGRQQLKWFMYAAVPAGMCFSFVLLSYIIVDFTEVVFGTPFIPFWGIYDYILPIAVFALLVVPVFAYIAILRYRLYDIDVVINRTLVYGTLTVTLVALYFGGIVVLQRIFVTLTGQQSTLAVVASTLLIAALFTPLRRRIQGFIDRRFYRSKYDARKTLETFSLKLRDETDLEALNNDLVGVVKETMQPAHVSLWLRPDLPQRRVSTD
jgi:hypothetical protein